MRGLLSELHIPDQTPDGPERTSPVETGARVALCSVALNLALVFLKYGLAVYAGSLALKADAVHSIADVISSASIWAGIKIAHRKTKFFPYGLYKVENLVALITVALLAGAAYEIVQGVLAPPMQIRSARLPLAMGGVVLIVFITWAFSRYELRRGQALTSPSLVADARHIATDMFSALIILSALIGSYLHLAFPLDRAVALVIVALIAWAAFKIAVDAIRVLLDASLDFPTLNTIREIIGQDPRVGRVNSLMGRNSGSFKFIEADLALKIKDFQKAHQVAGNLESRIKAEIPNVDRVLIHYEPLARDTVIHALPLTEDQRSLSEHFGEAPYFLLITTRARDGSFLEERVLPNPYREVASGKGIKVGEWLVGLGVDEVIVPKSFAHKGPYYVLADAGSDMRPTDLREVAAIKAELLAPDHPAAADP
jgi:cation diffusion facilitator family transporter